MPPAGEEIAYLFAGFELRPGRQLLRNGEPVAIGSTALALLGVLVQARGDVVTKDELFAALWCDVVVVDNALHQHVRALRKALGADAELIGTVARTGYRFAGDVEAIAVRGHDDVEPARPPALPAPATPLVGRDDELAAVDALLRTHRCVTLLGPGGIGKTRLALEIANARAAAGETVYLAELAAVAGGEHVGAAVAAAIGLAGPSTMAPLARVAHALRDAGALVVLDNCEHVIDAAAEVARELGARCATLRILATSQRPLGIAGEQRFQLPMLAVPPAGTSDRAALAASAAVQLLVARVADCDARLAFDDDALAAAAELCRQLDGNALAIEMAAVRVATLGVDAVLAGLADRFRILAGERRGALAKHRSLHATIDWSHALLTDAQRRTFRRMAVFAGGWTLPSAVAVAGATEPDTPGEDIASDLAELVERSLVGRDAATRSPRFRMLETQRAYAREQLGASGELRRAAAAHARHLGELFETAHVEWDATADDRWLARYGPERDNLRAALRTAVDGGDAALAARLAGASMWLWRASGTVREFEQVLGEALLRSDAALASAAAPRLLLARAYALHAVSTESERIRDAATRAVDAFAATTAAAGDALAAAAAPGAAAALDAANAMLCLASAYAQLGDTAAHRLCLARIEPLLASAPRGKTYGWFCGSHAWAAQLAGAPREALAWAIRSRAAYRASGGWYGETRAMLHIADLQLAIGDVDASIATGNETVERLQGGAHRVDLGRALANLGAAWFAHGEQAAARSCWASALEELRGADFTYWVFDHLALLAIAEGRDDCAARLVGYADAGYARLNKGKRVQNEERARARAVGHLEARHRADELATWRLEGANASEDETIASALQSATTPTRGPRRFALARS